MIIDPLRHLTVFSPFTFGNKRVDVIGAGATGSRIALSLAKLGIENIHVWDFDKVEEHNIPNQAFGLDAVGKTKTKALFDLILAATGTRIVIHDEKVDGTQLLGEIVFLLTDTMSSRKEIWERGLKLKFQTKLMIETRMGADNGRIYVVDPRNLTHCSAWEETLYSDKEAEVSACGASVSVGPTAEVVAGFAVWQMMRWYAIEQQGGEDQLENEILFSLRPTVFITRQF